MSKNLLKMVFLGLSLFMFGLVIFTSLKSDMFNLPEAVIKEPWFWTTLIDFYIAVFMFSLWVIYKENHWVKSLFWILSFIMTGSIGMAFYVFIQFAILKEGQSIAQVLLPKSKGD